MLVDKNDPVQYHLFAFTQVHKHRKFIEIHVLYIEMTLLAKGWRRNGFPVPRKGISNSSSFRVLVVMFGFMRTNSKLWLKKKKTREAIRVLAQIIVSSHVIVVRRIHSLGKVEKQR